MTKLTITVRSQKDNISKSFGIETIEDCEFISDEVKQYLKHVYGDENVKNETIG